MLNLCQGMTSRGHTIDVITTYPRYRDSDDYRIEIPSVSVHYLTADPMGKKRSYFAFFIKALKRMAELHREKRFDVIMAQSSFSLLAILPVMAGKLLGLPAVYLLTSPLERKSRISKLASRVFLAGVETVVATSGNVAKSLKTIVSDDRIEIIPPFIDLLTYNSAVSGENVRRELALNDCPVLFSLGNLERSRNIDTMIAALEVIKETMPDIKLLIAMAMPIEEYQSASYGIKDKIRSANLENNIIPLGILNNIADYIAASDIVLASFDSIRGIVDYPLTILQAMACGKPVVASTVGGISELVQGGKAGLLVEPNDAVGMADAVMRLLDNRGDAKGMGERGEKYILDNFKPDASVSKLEHIIQEICSRSGGKKNA